MTESIEAFWQRCLAAVPSLASVPAYRTRTFGNDERFTRRLLDLIRAGEKTGTFSVDWEFDGRPGERPEPGDHYVVVDHAGQPELVIRVTATEVVPFREVAERHTRHEGKALRAPEAWRKVHWEYWSGTLATLGLRPAEDMPILFQQFELVYPA
jgi:uncharacterized protein YhfF